MFIISVFITWRLDSRVVFTLDYNEHIVTFVLFMKVVENHENGD